MICLQLVMSYQLIAINWGGMPQLHLRPQLIADALVVAHVQNLSPLLLWIALAGFWGFLVLIVEVDRDWAVCPDAMSNYFQYDPPQITSFALVVSAYLVPY